MRMPHLLACKRWGSGAVGQCYACERRRKTRTAVCEAFPALAGLRSQGAGRRRETYRVDAHLLQQTERVQGGTHGTESARHVPAAPADAQRCRAGARGRQHLDRCVRGSDDHVVAVRAAAAVLAEVASRRTNAVHMHAVGGGHGSAASEARHAVCRAAAHAGGNPPHTVRAGAGPRPASERAPVPPILPSDAPPRRRTSRSPELLREQREHSCAPVTLCGSPIWHRDLTAVGRTRSYGAG